MALGSTLTDSIRKTRSDEFGTSSRKRASKGKKTAHNSGRNYFDSESDGDAFQGPKKVKKVKLLRRSTRATKSTKCYDLSASDPIDGDGDAFKSEE
jgi:hypothetical protein